MPVTPAPTVVQVQSTPGGARTLDTIGSWRVRASDEPSGVSNVTGAVLVPPREEPRGGRLRRIETYADTRVTPPPHLLPTTHGDPAVACTPHPEAKQMIIDYRAARLAAEYASGIRGVRLGIKVAEEPWGIGVFTAQPGDAFTVETTLNPTRSAVTGITMTVQGLSAQSFDAADVGGWSALLWGEGAVEKFLVPFCASAAGLAAGEFLEMLSAAWYGYDGTVVQVVGLVDMFGPAVPNASLLLEQGVGVLFYEVANPVLQVASLLDFLGTEGYVGPGRGADQPAAQTGYVIPVYPVAEQLGSVEMRDLAETIAGTRGVDMWLARSDRDGWNLWVGDLSELPSGWTVVTGINNPLPRPDRPAVTQVTVTVEGVTNPLTIAPLPPPLGTDPATPATVPDAFFWQPAAVERYLLPYYASVKGRLVPFFDSVLIGKWYGVTPLEAALDLATAAAALGAVAPLVGSDQLGVPTVEADTTVFGIIHLPRSEYIAEDTSGGMGGGNGPEDHTVLLSNHPDGTLRAHTLGGTPLA